VLSLEEDWAMDRLPIAPLDSRKQVILKAVVNDYVRTAEPVGSQVLVTRYQIGVKSATVRNEMAELSDLGYLRQPHTSAGRIPSDLGYRFYVDRLMGQSGLPIADAEDVRDRLAPHTSELEIILEHTCRILSDLARYTSVATDPNVRESVISHVSVASVSRAKLLAVLVLENGRVLHELIVFDSASGKFDPMKTSNFLNEKLGGKSLSDLRSASFQPSPDDPPDSSEVLRKVMDFLQRELELSEEAEVYLGGTGYILRQPEFKDADRLEAVLSALEHRSSLYKLFSSVYLGPGVTVIIGRENPLDSMHDLSFVGAKYYIGGRVAGTIGVVGPTRMDYGRAVGAVQFMAANLSDLLTALSLG
jgi:heat-inducible transcriptional repressor